MKTLKASKILIIPDIHQNLKFADECLKEDFDYVIFMGDYFDCFERADNEEYFSVKYTCDWLNTKYKELKDKAIWLVGNHDVAYLASYIPSTWKINKNSFYNCSGWTRSKASDFNKYISKEWIDNLELCCYANGYILSHAGFNYNQFKKPFDSIMTNINFLYDEWEKDKSDFMHKPFHWIWDIGECRGGYNKSGSPVWQDWNCEFSQMPSIKQIVGHTNGETVKQKGEDYCIDCYRTTYAIIDENENIIFKTLK